MVKRRAFGAPTRPNPQIRARQKSVGGEIGRHHAPTIRDDLLERQQVSGFFKSARTHGARSGQGQTTPVARPGFALDDTTHFVPLD
jgi:hypothetical protein